MLNFGQLRCLLELGGFPNLSEFEQTSEMRNSQGARGTREPPGFLQAAPLRCFFFLPPFYIAGPPACRRAQRPVATPASPTARQFGKVPLSVGVEKVNDAKFKKMPAAAFKRPFCSL